MDVDAGDLPVKPNFTALSAQEQNQNKVEFRRVGMRPLAGSSTTTTSSSSMCSTSTSLVQSMQHHPQQQRQQVLTQHPMPTCR